MSIPNNSSKIPSLSTIVSTYVINNSELYTRDEEKRGLFTAWENLLFHEDQDPVLQSGMKQIQNTFMKECKSNGTYQLAIKAHKLDKCNSCSEKFEKLFLSECKLNGNKCDSEISIKESSLKNQRITIKKSEPSTDKLFIEQCKSNGTYEAIVAPDIEEELLRQNIHYLCNTYKSWCDEQDKALELIWSHETCGMPVNPLTCHLNLPPLTSANAIRAWMANPDNAKVLNQIQGLSFVNCGLKTIPIELLNLPQLKVLVLNYNEITYIPNEIENSKLLALWLKQNQITSIPEEIANSPLQVLNLDKNAITNIPAALASSQLVTLLLNHNQIKDIPATFVNENSQLSMLFLNNNLITGIPPELAKSQLTQLFLENNQITDIPPALASSQLEVFCLNGNQITTIPETFSESNLKAFIIEENPILFTCDKACIHYESLIRDCDKMIEISGFSYSEHVLTKKLLEFNSYQCHSNFSKLLKICANQPKDIEAIKAAFENLKYSDQCHIFKTIYLQQPSKTKDMEQDPQWGEHHVFDDMNLFFRALKKTTAEKFECLSPEQKAKVCKEYHCLAEELQTDDLQRENGKNVSDFDCLTRLMDAIEKAGF